MINLDSSILAAIVIFLVLIAALNQLLFKPLMEIQAERESRTTGLMHLAKEKQNHQLDLFNQYQASIKNARMEGYRQQEQLRANALKKRAELLAQTRIAAEGMIRDSRDSLHTQVETAKQQLALDTQEMARTIASTVLGRAASDADSS
jgi:F-type H+-transporting ATPase subunit b